MGKHDTASAAGASTAGDAASVAGRADHAVATPGTVSTAEDAATDIVPAEAGEDAAVRQASGGSTAAADTIAADSTLAKAAQGSGASPGPGHLLASDG